MAADPRFTLTMILRNEAHNLPRSLGPVAGLFDEVVVVDTGSDDDTPQIAAGYGAQVTAIPWSNDFAAARNASIQAADGDWILWLDGDNYMSPQGVDLLRRRLDHHLDTVLWCTEVVVPDGERLIQKRVFPRRPDVYFAGQVHEQLVHPAGFKSELTAVEILHWGYQDRKAAREKGRRNLMLLEEMARNNPADPYVAYQMGKTLLNLRRFEEASGWLDRVITDPAGPDQNQGLFLHAHLLRAQALERMQQFEGAEAILRALLEKEPAYGPGYLALAKMDYAAGRYDRAIDGFLKFQGYGIGDPLSGLNPEQMHYTAAMLLGRSWQKKNDWSGAHGAYRQAARIKPCDPEAQLALAETALALKDPAAAHRHAGLALQYNPRNKRAAAILESLTGHTG